ncbi:hypothetical protein RI367_006503 [Sorochytrium milnesiophthora]
MAGKAVSEVLTVQSKMVTVHLNFKEAGQQSFKNPNPQQCKIIRGTIDTSHITMRGLRRLLQDRLGMDRRGPDITLIYGKLTTAHGTLYARIEEPDQVNGFEELFVFDDHHVRLCHLLVESSIGVNNQQSVRAPAQLLTPRELLQDGRERRQHELALASQARQHDIDLAMIADRRLQAGQQHELTMASYREREAERQRQHELAVLRLSAKLNPSSTDED